MFHENPTQRIDFSHRCASLCDFSLFGQGLASHRLRVVCVFCGLTLVFRICFLLVVISEHDTTASESGDIVVFIAHDLSAVEEEHSTDIQSDHDKEGHFLSTMYVVRDYQDAGKKILFKYGEIVEVLDTNKEDKWLVRKKVDSLQV